MTREKIKQVNKDLVIYESADISLTKKKIISFLMKDLGVTSISKDSNGWLNFGKHKISIKNITYLGFKSGEDRTAKKRVQFSNKLLPSFNSKSSDKVVLGHYINDDGQRLYVLFKLKSSKIGKSKSSHVNVYDLKNGFEHGIHTKIDKRGNEIIVLKPEFLVDVLSSLSTPNPWSDFANYLISESPEWDAKKSIKEMNDKFFTHAKQTEWAGWYLEYLAEDFFKGKGTVEAPCDIKFGTWKPDAFYEVPSELKFHSEGKNEIPGNDLEGISMAADKYGRIFLFVVSASVVMESDEFEISKWRADYFDREFVRKPNKRKLKSSAKITKVEFRYYNLEDIKKLKLFNQGKNSNGNARKPKPKYDASSLESF